MSINPIRNEWKKTKRLPLLSGAPEGNIEHLNAVSMKIFFEGQLYRQIPNLEKKFGKKIEDFRQIRSQINLLKETKNHIEVENVFNSIQVNFRKLKQPEKKLAAFLFILGSIEDLQKCDSKIPANYSLMRYLDKIYEHLPKNYKKEIKAIKNQQREDLVSGKLENRKDLYFLEKYSIASVETVLLNIWDLFMKR
jgi:beta-galactosidase beta subunit